MKDKIKGVDDPSRSPWFRKGSAISTASRRWSRAYTLEIRRSGTSRSANCTKWWSRPCSSPKLPRRSGDGSRVRWTGSNSPSTSTPSWQRHGTKGRSQAGLSTHRPRCNCVAVHVLRNSRNHTFAKTVYTKKSSPTIGSLSRSDSRRRNLASTVLQAE